MLAHCTCLPEWERRVGTGKCIHYPVVGDALLPPFLLMVCEVCAREEKGRLNILVPIIF